MLCLCMSKDRAVAAVLCALTAVVIIVAISVVGTTMIGSAFVFPFVGFICIQIGLFVSDHRKAWSANLRPIDVDETQFLEKHIQYDMKTCAIRPEGLSVDGALRGGGLAYYGMTWRAYLYMVLTVGMEYRWNVTWRIVRHYWNKTFQTSTKSTPQRAYLGLINTSLACYMQADGNIIVSNVKLPYRNFDSLIEFSRIEITLDHDTHEMKGMTLFPAQPKLDCEGVVHLDCATNMKDLIEAEILCINLAQFYSHSHIHWRANGVAQMSLGSTPKWALAKESADATTWMNYQAVHGSSRFYTDDPRASERIAETLVDNASQGLPVHGKAWGAFSHKMLPLARTHRMVIACRERLAIAAPEVTGLTLQALLSATVYHSADHYYLDLFFTSETRCKALSTDHSLSRNGVIAVNRYYTRKMRCVEHLDDPIARALYEGCATVDPVFARKSLQIACAS